MRRLATALAALLVVLSVPAAAADGIATLRSEHSVKVTLDRLASALEGKGIRVMARIDHAAGAKAAGLDLRPTELLVFGNPKLGTPLMQANRQIGLGLPMKVLAWEDEQGQVHLAYTKPAALAAQYGVSGKDEILAKMSKALENFTKAAAGAK